MTDVQNTIPQQICAQNVLNPTTKTPIANNSNAFKMILSAKLTTPTIPAKPATVDGSHTQAAASPEPPAQFSIPTAEPLSQEFVTNVMEATMWMYKQINAKWQILNVEHPTLTISTFVLVAMAAMFSSIVNVSLSAPSSVNIWLFRKSRSRVIRIVKLIGFKFIKFIRFKFIRLIRIVR